MNDVKTCVSTIRSHFEHTDTSTYEFLRDLLQYKKILVLGYSGNVCMDKHANNKAELLKDYKNTILKTISKENQHWE